MTTLTSALEIVWPAKTKIPVDIDYRKKWADFVISDHERLFGVAVFKCEHGVSFWPVKKLGDDIHAKWLAPIFTLVYLTDSEDEEKNGERICQWIQEKNALISQPWAGKKVGIVQNMAADHRYGTIEGTVQIPQSRYHAAYSGQVYPGYKIYGHTTGKYGEEAGTPLYHGLMDWEFLILPDNFEEELAKVDLR